MLLTASYRLFRITNFVLVFMFVQQLVLTAKAGHQPAEQVVDATVHSANLTDKSGLQTGFAHPSAKKYDLHYASSPAALVPKRDCFRLDQLKTVEDWLYRPDEMHEKATVLEMGYMGLTTKVHTFAYDDAHLHSYHNQETFDKSFGPLVDQEKCIQQLTNLAERAAIHNELKYGSKDINFHLLLDTYGRVPAGMHLGNSVWPGVYSECMRLRILDHNNQPQPTRYCWATAKHPDWVKGEAIDYFISLKTGLCLPKSCDARPYKNKYELIMNVTSFNFRHIDHDQAIIQHLYCLPDDDSEVHTISNSPEASVLAIIFTCWIALIVFCTVRYAQLKSRYHHSNEPRKPRKHHQNGSTRLAMMSKESAHLNLYQSLSITSNLKKLFDTSKTSTLFETANSIGNDELEAEGGGGGEKKAAVVEQVVDLSVLEGIKVICMFYVIMAHTVMVFSMILGNGREMVNVSNIMFLICNLVPAFAVNSFFAITGILTTYLMFKSNQARSLGMSPSKWVAFVVYRYLRIMPMYVLAVTYAKYLATYTSSGPFWDYGTSSLSPRYRCKQESWWWTLTFTSNFKEPLDNCVVSAWYLANDFQFALITPIFLTLLARSPRIGRWIIKLCILAGYLAGINSIMSTDAHDLMGLAKFMPHGFKTYVTFLNVSYTQPQYRIPAYLCGILLGHTLLEHERKKQLSNSSPKDNTDCDWPKWFKNHGLTIATLCILFVCSLPTISFHLNFSRSTAKLLVALFMSSCHIVFALSVGGYILLATTGHGNRLLNDFLSASFWKPLARLSLSVVLINVEVVTYFIQSSHQLVFVNFLTQTSLNLFSIVLTYLVSIVVCVFFEAPLRTALNQIVIYSIQKVVPAKKRVKQC